MSFSYTAYGMFLSSQVRLGFIEETSSSKPEIRIEYAERAAFRNLLSTLTVAPSNQTWLQRGWLEDGSAYLSWKDLSEYLISPSGDHILYCPDDRASPESVQVYLLGQALSFALVKKGIEPLHATVVVVGAEAIGFLGDNGYGKSTLAASFICAGHKLLTDDLLVLRQLGGALRAYPGPARLKLFPDAAGLLLGKGGRGTSMNSFTTKLVIPLGTTHSYSESVPLRALYSLPSPPDASSTSSIQIERLSRRKAFMEVLSHTFNSLVVDSPRLRTQFHSTANIVGQIPVKRLQYPRRLDVLSSVRETILSDLRNTERA
jgi:hypothetical protein